MKNSMLNVAIGAVMIASIAQALPSFNTVTWNTVTVSGGVVYQDGHNQPPDFNDLNYNSTAPSQIDIVGNAANPAAYYAYDGQYMYFRMRVDSTPDVGVNGPQYVWQAVLNTSGDATADWVIQWDMTSDKQVELLKATGGSPSDTPKPFGNLAYTTTTQATNPDGVANNWYTWSSAGDTFADTPAEDDYYVDFAFDKATLDATLIAAGETAVNSFQVVFASSQQHNVSNKDLPDQGWSDAITVPEPTSMALLALGVTVLAMRRRKV